MTAGIDPSSRANRGSASSPMMLAGHPRPFKVEVLQTLNRKKVFVQWSTFVHRENADNRADILKKEGFVVRVMPPLAPKPIECIYCLGTLCDAAHPGSCLL